jgi:putative membrane protein
MPLIAQMFAVIAAVLHIWFFVLGSLLWRRPSTWHRFRIESQADADLIAPMARNQGFYNLFLALGVLFGVLTAHPDGNFIHLGDGGSGEAIALFGCVVMVGAGIVLVLGDRRFLPAALIQAVPPALAIVTAILFDPDNAVFLPIQTP